VNRFLALLLVLLAVAGLCLLSWYGPPRTGSRRAASAFLADLALTPIVDGAATAAGGRADVAPSGGSWNAGGDSTGADRDVQGGRSETRWWKRRYDTASCTVTASLDSAQARVFLAAVRESLDRRLSDAGATTRDVNASDWVGAAGGPGLSQPLALEVPYATRRRVGWLTVHARHDGQDALTLWVNVHEGPRPSD